MVSENIIKEIASEIDNGFNCFLNLKTNETFSIFNDENFTFAENEECEDQSDNEECEDLSDIEECEDLSDNEECEDQSENIENDDNIFILISPMESSESLRIMVDFAESVEDEKIRDILLTALQRPKPLDKFKFELERYPEYRNQWFEFKEKETIEYVRNKIQLRLNSEEDE